MRSALATCLFSVLILALVTALMMASTEVVAQTFDVDQASHAYLSHISAEEIENTNAYVNTGYVIMVLTTILNVLIAFILLRFGWSEAWRNWAERVFSRKFLQTYIYIPIYMLAIFVMSLPLVIYGDFIVEHQYGLATQSFGAWFIELLQSLAVELIGLTIFVSLFYLIVRLSPQRWWLWGAGLVTTFIATVVFLAPILIMPLFNDYKPMEEGPLKEQILSIARANGMTADEVRQVDASKQTNRVSANVSGLFGTTQISLNDNLLNRASDEGVEAVMAHEIGHYVLNHLWKMMAFYTLLFLLGFAIASAAFNAIVQRMKVASGIRDATDIAGFPLLYAILSVFLLITTPVFNSITRVQETEADLFAINATHNPDAWSEIALLTAEYRKLKPPVWEENILNHHPSPYARVHMAMVWKAENLKENEE